MVPKRTHTFPTRVRLFYTEHVGGFVWTTDGRDAGIDVVRITFIRVRRESSSLLTRDCISHSARIEHLERRRVRGLRELRQRAQALFNMALPRRDPILSLRAID